MDILHIDASVRPDSRTKRLTDYLLKHFKGDKIKRVHLTHECIMPLTKESLEHRTLLCEQQEYDEAIFRYAKEYANADMIVVTAPYWDLSFPATLKTYIEAINVIGITFKYNEKGEPEGMCKAKNLIYITTAGGKIYSDEFGFGYIKELAEKYHGIKNTEYIKAEELDIIDAKEEDILQKAEENIDKIIKNIKK